MTETDDLKIAYKWLCSSYFTINYHKAINTMPISNANNIIYAYEWRERALRTGDGIIASTICYWIILCELMAMPEMSAPLRNFQRHN